MREIENYLGFHRQTIHSVMLIGGSRVAFYLTQLLEKRGLEVKIIEKDYKHCKFLAGQLNEAIILNGDGSDIDLLQDEGVQIIHHSRKESPHHYCETVRQSKSLWATPAP